MHLRPAAAAMLFVVGHLPTGGAAAPLPEGFGGVQVGSTWAEAQSALSPVALDIRLTDLDRRAHACGYREGRVRTRNGSLHVTAHDFVVTAMHYSTPLREGSTPEQVARLVRQTYGIPGAEVWRDPFGRQTDARRSAAHVALDYGHEHPVRFSASGAPLWRYQVSVTFRDRRLHENRTARCARSSAKQDSSRER